MRRRITTLAIRQYDLRYQTSFLRELEMALADRNPGIIIQFFKDLSVYGLHEALIYLRQYVGDAYVEQHVVPVANRITASLTRIRIHAAIRIRIEEARTPDEWRFWNDAATEFRLIPVY